MWAIGVAWGDDDMGIYFSNVAEIERRIPYWETEQLISNLKGGPSW